ncbi:MAG: twin-arginine translocation pathway signal, partial [uncultured bacterium]
DNPKAPGRPHGQREKLAEFHSRRMTLAHADLSGFSLFEEAQYRGVLAAERVMQRRGVRCKSSL